MSRYCYGLVPLLILLVTVVLACFIGYGIEYYFDPAWPLRKIIRKLSQLFLLLSIIPAMMILKLSREQLGFAEKILFFKQLRVGFVIGVVTLLPVFIMLYGLGVHVLDNSQPWTWVWLARKLVYELFLALLISVFEEPLFRGILLVGLLRKLPVMPAVAITAFYYAILHFLDTKNTIPVDELSIWSGFKLMADSFANVYNPRIFSAFLSLFMVGVVLGVMRTTLPHSLGVCIGCHASWVWQIKLNKTFLNTNGHSDFYYLISDYDGVTGPFVIVWLVVTGFGLYKLINNQKSQRII